MGEQTIIEEYKMIMQQKLDAFELLFDLRPEIMVDGVHVIASVGGIEVFIVQAFREIDETDHLQCLEKLMTEVKAKFND